METKVITWIEKNALEATKEMNEKPFVHQLAKYSFPKVQSSTFVFSAVKLKSSR